MKVVSKQCVGCCADLTLYVFLTPLVCKQYFPLKPGGQLYFVSSSTGDDVGWREGDVVGGGEGDVVGGEDGDNVGSFDGLVVGLLVVGIIGMMPKQRLWSPAKLSLQH